MARRKRRKGGVRVKREYILALRVRMDLNRPQFCDRADELGYELLSGTLRAIEDGRAKGTTLETITIIADTLAVPVESLIERRPELVAV